MCTMEYYRPDDPVQSGEEPPQLWVQQALPPNLPRNVDQQPAQRQIIQRIYYNPLNLANRRTYLENWLLEKIQEHQMAVTYIKQELVLMQMLEEKPPFPKEFSGPCNMNLAVTSDFKNKHLVKGTYRKTTFVVFDGVYCSASQRLFTKPKTEFSIIVKWNIIWSLLTSYISVCLVFADEKSSNDIVRTCQQHANSNDSPQKRENVLRAVGDSAIYCNGQRYSVLHPVTTFGNQPIHLSIACLISCPTGINRRPTNLIVEMHNAYGEVLGRQKLGIHITTTPVSDYKSISSGQRTDDNSQTQSSDVRIVPSKRKLDENVSITLRKKAPQQSAKRRRLI